MPDYAKMYRHVFNAQTDAISLLQKSQQEAEEMYMSAPDTEIRLIGQESPQENQNGED